LGGIGLLIISPFFIVLAALVADVFGAAILYNLMVFFFMLAVPTIWPQWFNLIAMPLNGLIVDVLKKLLNKSNRLFSFVGGFVFTLLFILESILLYFTIGLPYTQSFPKFLINPLGLGLISLLFSLIGGLSGYAAFLVYKKLLNTSVIKRIQGK
jgi:hypothetical protein